MTVSDRRAGVERGTVQSALEGLAKQAFSTHGLVAVAARS